MDIKISQILEMSLWTMTEKKEKKSKESILSPEAYRG